MAISQNGWPANEAARRKSYLVPGTTRKLSLQDGVAGQVLIEFAAWFDKNVETIDNDKVMDDWGYAPRPIRGSTTTLSNHASATAMDLNATQHPLGVRNTFTDPQEVKIRTKLKQLGGAIRGGLDYARRADEMHFEINVPPTAIGYAKLKAALATLQGVVSGPSVVKPPAPQDVVNDYSKRGDMVIAASSIRYAANGGYLRSGQAEAQDDVETFLAWWLRLNRSNPVLKERTERDVRVWRTFVNQDAWASAGLQLTGIIKNFQRHFGLEADGVFGPKSAAVMARDNFVLI